jgi:hypothetical protein
MGTTLVRYHLAGQKVSLSLVVSELLGLMSVVVGVEAILSAFLLVFVSIVVREGPVVHLG